MSALSTLIELRMRAKRTRATIREMVILADDTICMVEAGPRGGWRIVS